MSRRERRSASLGRHRDRPSRDSSKPPDEDLSTRHNISNFLLTLQRIQASEEENRQLRKENQLLRQRARSSRLSSSSFRQTSFDASGEQTTITPEAEDQIIAADVKRNSLLFVGDAIPTSPEHAALEAQYKKLQEDFETVKEFLKHLFQHALTLSPSDALTQSSKDKEHTDINTYKPTQSIQLERNLADIHGQINQLRNSQDQQQVRMDQVQQALDNVLCHSSVRNDVTMRMVRQQDKMKEITRHVTFLETQLMSLSVSLRQAEEKSRLASSMGQKLQHYVATNSKHLKGNTKDELSKMADQLSQMSRVSPSSQAKMEVVSKLISHVTTAANQGQTLVDNRPPADVIDAMSKMERLIGSDWHRLGRMLGLTADVLDEIGKFTNFDLTSRVEKVLTQWCRVTRGVSAESLRQGLDKMDRDILLLAESPACKDWWQLPPEVNTYVIAHVVDVSAVVNHLAGQGFVSQESRNFILGAPQEHRRACRLLHTVVYMGSHAVQALCTALDSLKQSVVAGKIRGCFPSHLNSSDGISMSYNNNDNNNKMPSYPDRTMTTTTSTINRQISSSRVADAPSSTTTTPASSKQGEKPRKKRSRSLFTRKNKLRDSENDADLAMDMPTEYNYHYPSVNPNLLNSSSSGSGSFGREGREEEEVWKKEDLPPPGPTKRQYGRQNRHPPVINSSQEVIV